MNNPGQDDQNQQQQGGQQDQGGQQGGSRVARSPVRAASSRAGRTSPVSKVVSNADINLKARHFAGPSFYMGAAHLGRFCFLIDGAFGDFA